MYFSLKIKVKIFLISLAKAFLYNVLKIDLIDKKS